MNILDQIGGFGYLAFATVGKLRFSFRDRERVLYQLDHVGVQSIPLVLLVGFFAGAIIAWQAAYQFVGLVSLDLMGKETTRAIVMEMGPVLTALVVSGRIGASMTAEIGTMKVTEQLDALRTMDISPIRYIVMPRFLGLTVMMPVLTSFAVIIAVFGAFGVSNYFMDLSPEIFFDSVKSNFALKDLMGGIFKSFIFGIIISLVGCYMGLNTTGGAEGVGRATIRSFVLCAVIILICDSFLWLILF
ncbi:MAG: ABC transporter permease [Bacteroidia bacterium]|nr:ABC transporter permease [Bacteroidia bacterium]